MYYISKFCRICVQTDVELLDLNTIDFDKIKFSEKLEVCTKMVVTRESLSTEICLQCISKLRTSYQFLDMCRKSSKKLHGYYRTLLCKQEDDESIKNFINTDLHVAVTPIAVEDCYKESDTYEENDTFYIREKRKRITKEQRCSLLKKLLSNPDQREWSKNTEKYTSYCKTPSDSFFGGLKSIINFTKNYEFGIPLDRNFNCEATPLEKLTAFSDEFFKKDFSEFRNTILYIIENKDTLCDSGDSEDEDYFNTPFLEEQWEFKQEMELNTDYAKFYENSCHFHTKDIPEDSKENIVSFEEVIVEPDIKIKTEMDYEDAEFSIDNSCLDSIKKEHKEEWDTQYYSNNYPVTSSITDYSSGGYEISPSITIEKVSSMMSLNNFVGNYQHKRTFSPNNVRCRTRQNPYINPLLKQQFLYRSFKCDKCSRYFKSPGYLKAHHSKVH